VNYGFNLIFARSVKRFAHLPQFPDKSANSDPDKVLQNEISFPFGVEW